MPNHPVVSEQEWLTARRALLLREKEETRLRDQVNAERLALPWIKVEKQYRFETPAGQKTLADLFCERSQLLIYHFMLAPEWDAGCVGCSFLADHFDGMLPHLEHHDVTFTAVSRASLEKIQTYQRRMGWHFPWVSSSNSDFNYDYNVSFTPQQLASGKAMYNFGEIDVTPGHMTDLPGLSSFYKDETGDVFRTYSTYARGAEQLIGTLMILDRAPKGRNEDKTMHFVRRHDEYVDTPQSHACCSSEKVSA